MSLEFQQKARAEIGHAVHQLRVGHSWTQALLARELGLSQSRLSELERGGGSFTAEQFLTILGLFNVGADHFTARGGTRDRGRELQSALARLGANHLLEADDLVVDEARAAPGAVIRDVLIAPEPRWITALAPVLVRAAGRVNLFLLHAELAELGHERRLAWVVDNTLVALARLAKAPGSEGVTWKRLRLRVRLRLRLALDAFRRSPPRFTGLDIFDETIRTKRTLQEVRNRCSHVSKRWSVITSLQPDDFIAALRAAHAIDS